MAGFRLVLRALVAGPAMRRPARVVLPVAGVAIGVAAAAAIHHANQSVTASFRDALSSVVSLPIRRSRRRAVRLLCRIR